MKRQIALCLVLFVMVAAGGFLAGRAFASPQSQSEFAELEQVMNEDFAKMYEYLGKQQNDQVGLRIEKARGRIQAYIKRTRARHETK